MIRKSRSALIFILDLIILYACFLGVFVYFKGFASIPLSSVLLVLYVALIWFIIAINSSVSNISIDSKEMLVLRDLIVAYSVMSASIIGIIAIFGEFAPNNKLILWPLLFALIMSSALRLCYLISIKRLVKMGYNQKSALLIGGGRAAEKVINKILLSPDLGYRIYGILADEYLESLPMKFYLGKLKRFEEIVQTGLVDEVIIALPLKMENAIIDMVHKCNHEGIRPRIVPDFFKIIPRGAVLSELGDIPLISIRNEPLSLLKNRVLKRIFDIVVSLMSLVFLSPLFIVIALAIKATSKGPVFFKQERVSLNNKTFQMIKFRSMYNQSHKSSNTNHTSENDPRVTTVGRFLRRYSLDELPQFWNVLIGDMSIVGPRPELTYFANEFKEKIDKYRVRHLVRSGITGLAQVNGYRGNTSKEKRVTYDMHYIENWNFWFDLKILWLTLFGRDTNKNAY
jgi:Undecaprenyl-phosphate glucose phosphotransferase